MAKAKRTTLPKDFEQLLRAGDPEAIKAVFDTCDVNARGGTQKKTVLAFSELSDDTARWLVEQGADISATSSSGETPLHNRAGHWQGKVDILLALGADVNCVDSKAETPLHKAASAGNVQATRTLLEHGARTDAVNNQGLTPLALALQRCSNPKIPRVAEIAELLLAAQRQKTTSIRSLTSRLFGRDAGQGDPIPSDMRDLVVRIGTDFEFHRSSFNPESVDETSAALDKLYVLFAVQPVPRRSMHDGQSPILAKAARWEDRHQELWEMLVPSSGAASTVQGEVIRISGRLTREIDGNGGVNWDAQFAAMADALLVHFGSGEALPAADREEASAIVRQVKKKYGDVSRLCELAVGWVGLNPNPVLLAVPSYDR